MFEVLSLKYQMFHTNAVLKTKEWWLVPAVRAGPSTASSTTLWSFSWRWIRSCLMTAHSSSGLRKTSRRALFVHPKDSTFSLAGWTGSLARFLDLMVTFGSFLQREGKVKRTGGGLDQDREPGQVKSTGECQQLHTFSSCAMERVYTLVCVECTKMDGFFNLWC